RQRPGGTHRGGKIVTPRPEAGAVESVKTDRIIRRHHIAVGIMFPFIARRILPVVEDLTAEDVPADPPEMPPALRAQIVLALPDGIGIYGFGGDMQDRRRRPECDRQR